MVDEITGGEERNTLPLLCRDCLRYIDLHFVHSAVHIAAVVQLLRSREAVAADLQPLSGAEAPINSSTAK